MIDTKPWVPRSNSFLERAGLRWMYLLVAVPVLTEVLETGRLARTPREWMTEIVVGVVIAFLVRKVRQDHLAVLALSRSDALTGLWNRRAFEEAIARTNVFGRGVHGSR